MIFTNSGYMAFHDTSAAGNATITSTASLDLASSGSTKFFNSSNAGNGTFILEGGVLGSGGVAVFNDDSSAANGTFTVGGVMGSGGGGANLYFLGNSSAGSGNFTVNGNQFVDADPLRGFVVFFQNCSANDSLITINGSVVDSALSGLLEFAGTSTAGNATLIANGGSGGSFGGEIEFFENATGGTSRVEIFGNALLDISAHSDQEVTIGSLEGNGEVFLGSNSLNTAFTGEIQDGGILAASGGSLTKIGTSTLILTGTNTYSGGTSINGGLLQVDNTSGSATDSGPVTVDSGGKLGGTGAIAGHVSNGGVVAPAETLDIGSYSQTSGGSLDIEIATLLSYDQLLVSGHGQSGWHAACHPGWLQRTCWRYLHYSDQLRFERQFFFHQPAGTW